MFLKFTILITLLVSNQTYAADAPDEVSIGLPSSRLREEPRMVNFHAGSFEFLVSSWVPTNFSATTRLPNTENFHTTVPRIEMQFITAEMFKSSTWSGLIGGTFSYGARSGAMDSGSQYVTEKQTAYFAGAKLGLQHRFLTQPKISPYFSLELLPTVALIAESPISRGSTRTLWPYQLVLGSTFNVGMENWLLTIEGFTENFENTGAAAGLRLNL